MVLHYGIYRLYKLWSPSPSSSDKPSQVKSLNDMVYADDYLWGGPSIQQMRSPRSIQATQEAAGACQKGGGFGDKAILVREVNQGVIEDDNGAFPSARSSLIRLSPRTTSGSSFTAFPSATTSTQADVGSSYRH